MLFDPKQMGGMSPEDFMWAKEYYNACLVAQYVQENFKPELSDEDALQIGYIVNDKMSDLELGAEEAEFIREAIYDYEMGEEIYDDE